MDRKSFPSIRSPASRIILQIVGDSISLQYRAYLREHLKKQFRCIRETEEAKALKNLDVPSGSNAGDSASVFARTRVLLRPSGLKPDVVLLNCGLHDIKVNRATGEINVSAVDYRKNLELTVNCAQEANVAIV